VGIFWGTLRGKGEEVPGGRKGEKSQNKAEDDERVSQRPNADFVVVSYKLAGGGRDLGWRRVDKGSQEGGGQKGQRSTKDFDFRDNKN